MSVYVVDNSVVAKWFREEDYTPEAARLLKDEHDLHGPDLLAAEFTNMLWRWLRQGLITPLLAADAVFEFGRHPVTLHPPSEYMEQALKLAYNEGHPAYDCFYLALALRLDAQCVTADRRFYDALVPSFPETMLWVADIPGV